MKGNPSVWRGAFLSAPLLCSGCMGNVSFPRHVAQASLFAELGEAVSGCARMPSAPQDLFNAAAGAARCPRKAQWRFHQAAFPGVT
jgi:hypothetical protein